MYSKRFIFFLLRLNPTVPFLLTLTAIYKSDVGYRISRPMRSRLPQVLSLHQVQDIFPFPTSHYRGYALDCYICNSIRPLTAKTVNIWNMKHIHKLKTIFWTVLTCKNRLRTRPFWPPDPQVSLNQEFLW